MSWFLDWRRAIEVNRQALVRIVAGLVALLATQGEGLRLPLSAYRLITRVLFPAESAMRRLIVVAARDVVVPVPKARPLPPGTVIARKGQKPAARMAFQLFDTRKRFGDRDDEESPPKIHAAHSRCRRH